MKLLNTTFQSRTDFWSNHSTTAGLEFLVEVKWLGQPCNNLGESRETFRQFSAHVQHHSCTCIHVMNLQHASPEQHQYCPV